MPKKSKKNVPEFGNSLKTVARKKIARRLTNVPRDHISFYMSGQEYKAFHAVTKDWTRVELNKKSRLDLIGKAWKKKRKHDFYSSTCEEPTTPRTETRKLELGKDTNKMHAFMSIEWMLGKTVGWGCIRVLKGTDFAILTSIYAKFVYNAQEGTQGVRFSFSWSVYSPDRELKFYPHTKTSISRRNFLRQHVFSFPAEVFCRGRQRDGSRAAVDIGFNRWRRFEDLSCNRPAPIALPDSGEDCFLCFCFNLITHGYVGDRNCRDDATCNLPSGHSPRVADAGGSCSSAGSRPSCSSSSSSAVTDLTSPHPTQQLDSHRTIDLPPPRADEHITGYADSDDQVRRLQAEIDDLGDY